MSFLKRKFRVLILLLVVSVTAIATPSSDNQLSPRAQEAAFIRYMVKKHHFNKTSLTHLFNGLHVNHKIVRAMTSPFEKQSWTHYRHFFITPERVRLGARYLKMHHHILLQMQHTYGIPASIIVAIIGVETEYGMHLGKYSILNALYTLSFYYPSRQAFFRKELEEYLLLTRENHLNPRVLKGSYAGAMGIPQFMPSSYRHYGKSSTKNKAVNLFKQNDAIVSVANYFHKNGWAPFQPITKRLCCRHAPLDKNTTRIYLPLANGGAEYWEGYHNFNVIMTYNHNVVYAMVVYQLSKAIEKQYAHPHSQK